MKIWFYLDENPTSTAQEKGTTIINGRVHHYTKKNVLEMRQTYAIKILEYLSTNNIHIGSFYGAVSVSVTFGFATKDSKKWKELKTTKPDVDNCVKLVLDVLADLGFFAVGDQQVSLLSVGKFWSEKPYIYIQIEEVAADSMKGVGR